MVVVVIIAAAAAPTEKKKHETGNKPIEIISLLASLNITKL